MLAIGIDVSKAKLDVFYSGKIFSIDNQDKAIMNAFNKVERNSKIVLESTGKYHRLAHKKLSALGFDVMVINPFQSRHFAKAMNVICKTDSVDAKILALYAEKMDHKPTPVPTDKALNMQELSRHLDDLRKSKLELEARLRDSDGYVAESLKETIDFIGNKIKEAETRLEIEVVEDDALLKKCNLLETIPGIGTQTAIMLLSNLNELGTIGKKQISALAGLAPQNNDSGSFRGKRYVRGGRVDVRAKLYMPILGAATQHNERLKKKYDHLVASGKDKKVALIACMRKLVIWANSILASGKGWDENHEKLVAI